MDIGQVVRVVRLNDGDPPMDKDAERRFRRFVGKTGRVVGTIVDDCGASPADPLYVVRVPKLGTDGFWAEELGAVG